MACAAQRMREAYAQNKSINPIVLGDLTIWMI